MSSSSSLSSSSSAAFGSKLGSLSISYSNESPLLTAAVWGRAGSIDAVPRRWACYSSEMAPSLPSAAFGRCFTLCFNFYNSSFTSVISTSNSPLRLFNYLFSSAISFIRSLKVIAFSLSSSAFIDLFSSTMANILDNYICSISFSLYTSSYFFLVSFDSSVDLSSSNSITRLRKSFSSYSCS